MAAFPKLVLTSAGIALQTKVQGGATLELTNIQMGSGQLNGQPIGPLTALISSNATVPIQSGQAIGQNTYQVEGFFTNADLSAGFWWREIGIFANDPDNGEILYAYANAGDAGDYIPTVTDQRIEKYIYLSMTLANATTVTVTIPQTDTYVLQSTVGQANGVAGLGGNGAVPVAQGGTGSTTAQDAVVALSALFAIAAAGAYNPEESYAVGDYCTYKGKLRKCSTAIPTGETWTEAHWTTTTVAAEMQELSSQLSNLAGTHPIKTYTNLSQLGLTIGQETIESISAAMPNGSILTFAVGNSANTEIYPYELCNALVFRSDISRVSWIIVEKETGNVATANWSSDLGFSGWNKSRTLPQEYDLPLADGWTVWRSSRYWKNQINEVTVLVSIRASAEHQPGSIIATLPVGYRPAYTIEVPAITGSGYTSGTVQVTSSGNVSFWGNSAVSNNGFVFAELPFLADS